MDTWKQLYFDMKAAYESLKETMELVQQVSKEKSDIIALQKKLIKELEEDGKQNEEGFLDHIRKMRNMMSEN